MARRQERRLAGFCGVDSGQILIVDPCYVDEGFSYDECCAMTLSEDGFGEAAEGVVSSSGFGDGHYPVWVTVEDHLKWGKRIAKMEIIFIDEEE